MQIGFIGLGKMGGNMVHRIRRDSEHEVVAFDFSADAVKTAEEQRRHGRRLARGLVGKLAAPRAVWIMVPAGDPTQETVEKLLGLLEQGDTIIDGGNSKWTESIARHAQCAERGVALRRRRHERRGVGARGRLLHDGRRRPGAVGRRADPRRARAARRLGADGRSGPGHYVKMVHNGIEYALMQGYAEGFELLHKSEYGLDLERIANLWGQGSVVRSWLLELAARAFAAEGNDWRDSRATSRTRARGAGRSRPGSTTICRCPRSPASLFTRFYSRADGDYAARMLAALRNQFGGHAVRQRRSRERAK